MQFNIKRPDSTENRILPKNYTSNHSPHPSSPLEPHEKQEPHTLPTNIIYPTPPIMPSHTSPAAPSLHSQEVPHPQPVTDEAAVLIRQPCDHVPIEGIE
jgi:hypothetical protein